MLQKYGLTPGTVIDSVVRYLSYSYCGLPRANELPRSLVDIYPSLIELVGVPRERGGFPNRFDGRSFVPLLNQKNGQNSGKEHALRVALTFSTLPNNTAVR